MASKLGKALGYSMDLGGDDSIGAMDEGDATGESADKAAPASEKGEPGANPAEVLAMKQFIRASTPEAKAQALKDFLEACGAIGSDY